MRPFIVLLTIAALLLCPYECAVRSAQAQSRTSAKRAACCPRCQVRQDSDSQPLPAPSDDGRSCVCEGAVFDASAPFHAETPSQVLFWMGTSDSAPALTHVSAATNDWRANWPLTSGSQLRVAIQSLLL